MASPARFELATPSLGNRCSIQLSYGDFQRKNCGVHLFGCSHSRPLSTVHSSRVFHQGKEVWRSEHFSVATAGAKIGDSDPARFQERIQTIPASARARLRPHPGVHGAGW
jgi:hypothetical protein